MNDKPDTLDIPTQGSRYLRVRRHMTDRSKFEQRLNFVRQLDRNNRIANFREAAEQLVDDYPESSSAWLQLGIAYTRIALYDEARKALDKSIRLSSKGFRSVPCYHKGLMYKEKGNLNLAEEWIRRSIDLNPKDPDARAFLGATLAKMGRYREAKAEWRKMIRLSEFVEDDVAEEGHFNLALIYRAEKRYRDSLRHVDLAIEIDPNYSYAKNLRKDLLEVLGDDA